MIPVTYRAILHILQTVQYDDFLYYLYYNGREGPTGMSAHLPCNRSDHN